jgi:hypothetical protein
MQTTSYDLSDVDEDILITKARQNMPLLIVRDM